jgi:targeting protein for Xklp2
MKDVTQAAPFSLETAKRGPHKAEIRKHQEEEQKQQKEFACFKARPNTVIYQAPKKEEVKISC